MFSARSLADDSSSCRRAASVARFRIAAARALDGLGAHPAVRGNLQESLRRRARHRELAEAQIAGEGGRIAAPQLQVGLPRIHAVRTHAVRDRRCGSGERGGQADLVGVAFRDLALGLGNLGLVAGFRVPGGEAWRSAARRQGAPAQGRGARQVRPERARAGGNGRRHGRAGRTEPVPGVGRVQGQQPGRALGTVEDHGAAGEDQAGVRGGGGDVLAAGFALELVAEVPEPAQRELTGVPLGGAERPAPPDAVEPAEERAVGGHGGLARTDAGQSGTVPDGLAEAAAVVGQDAEAAAFRGFRGKARRVQRGVEPHGVG